MTGPSVDADADVTVEALRTAGSLTDLMRATRAGAARAPGDPRAGDPG